MADLVAVRMQPEFLNTVKTVANAQGFLSVQEYVRDAVRRDIYNHYKRKLDEIIASAKDVKPIRPTPEQRDAWARAYMREVAALERAGKRPKDARAEIKRILAKKRKR